MEEISEVEKTENTVEQPVEENVEGIELTDTSNTEEPVEETKEVKTYTDAELDDILSKKIARERRKIEREYENKYSDYKDIADIVSKGLNSKDIKDAKAKVRTFYEDQGITFENSRSERDEKMLGRGDANELLELGFEEAEEEANKLASIGYENLSVRDKEKFNVLASNLEYEKHKQELTKMGVSTEILDKKEFKEFASQFNSNTPFKKIYEYYKQTLPKKEVNTIGSMKGIPSKVESDYYTEDELNKLSLDDLSKPEVWEKARKSMLKKGE